MSVQLATEPQHSKLSGAEILGFQTILGSLQLDELIIVMRIITRSKKTNADNRDEAINIIVTNAGRATDILGRQKVTKNIILNYLWTLPAIDELAKPPNNSMSKLELSNMCLKIWDSDLFQESNQLYRNLVEAFVTAFHTPQDPDLDDNQNQIQYCEAFRNLIWGNKCQLLLLLPHDSFKVHSEIPANSYNGITSLLFHLKSVIKMEFNLNDERDSLLMKKDMYNSIIINVSGNCRIGGNNGTLDLILKYSGRYIEDIIFMVDGLNIPKNTCTDIRIHALTESFEGTQISRVPPRY